MRRAEVVPNARSSRAVYWSPNGDPPKVDEQPACFPTGARIQNRDSEQELTRQRRIVDLDKPFALGGSRRGVDVTSFVHRRAGEVHARGRQEQMRDTGEDLDLRGTENPQPQYITNRSQREQPHMPAREDEFPEGRHTVSLDELNGVGNNPSDIPLFAFKRMKFLRVRLVENIQMRTTALSVLVGEITEGGLFRLFPNIHFENISPNVP